MVAIIRLELSIPHATNLKEKRRVLQSIMERVRARYGVAAAEVEGQNLWQRAVVGLALVSGEEAHAREMAARVVDYVQSHFEGDVCRADVDIV